MPSILVVIAVSDIISAIFVFMSLISQITGNDNSKSMKHLKLLHVATLVWLTADAVWYFSNIYSINYWLTYYSDMFAYAMSNVVALVFLHYCEAFISEKATLKKWTFRIPRIIALADIVIDIIWFVSDKIVVFENGHFEIIGTVPAVVMATYPLLLLYSPVVAFTKRKKLGKRSVLILSSYGIPLAVSIVILLLTDNDFSVVAGAVSLIFIITLLQKDSTQERTKAQAAHKAVAQNNTRILALEDNFESLFDVELETGKYESFFKGQVYEKLIKDNIISTGNYYTDMRDMIALVVLPEDREGLNGIVTRNVLQQKLSESASFDCYFRVFLADDIAWYKVRTVYKDEEKKNVIVGVFNAEKEIAAREIEEQQYNELIDSVVSSCNLAYRVNMADDSFKLLRADYNIFGRDEIFGNFSEAKEFFVTKVLHPSDRERLKNELDYSVIRRRLAESQSYTVEYKALLKGATIWHEMTVISIGHDEVAIGFAVKNQELVRTHLEGKKYDEYFALFVIDLDTEMIQSIKTTPIFETAKLGEAVPYGPSIKQFIPFCDNKEARDFFKMISDIKYFRNEFVKEDKRTFSYKSFVIGGGKWIEVSCYVIERHENGSPATITLGFSLIDALATAKQELQVRLKEDMQMIGGLAGEYHALYYYNISEKIFKIYSMDDQRFPDSAEIVRNGDDPIETFRKFAVSDIVHPDDRYLLSKLTVDYIKEKLAHRKKFSVRFRRRNNDDYLWSEIDFVKYENIDETPNVVVLGFAVRDSEIRGEQALSSCFSVLGKEISPQESIDELLATAGEFYGADRAYVFEYGKGKETLSNTYEWCKDGIEPMIAHLQSVPSIEIEHWIAEFESHGAFCMDVLDEKSAHSEEGLALLEMQGIESLIAAPMMNGDEIVGFIGVDNPSKAKKNLSILRNVSVVAYSEILKRKENDEEHTTLNKLADAFMSVYYVDISTDYMRTWKIDDDYKEAYGITRNYSVSMGGYVRENIAEYDRERCIEMTGTGYILEQFREKDRFSIDMTDIMLGYERNFVFDYIKVNDEGTQFVVCCRDVTESLAKEKEQQKQLEEARDAANAANKSKTSFLFNMSHDIRTPMNAITGFTSMAKKYVDDTEKVSDYLDKIDTSGQQLLTLVNQVLEMARIESGKIEIEEKPVNIQEEYNDMVTVLTEQANTNGLEFHHTFSDVVHNNILADRARMSSITLNITGNAMKYTPRGGRIDFSLREIPSTKDGYATFVFTVQDTGIGMSEEYLKVLFDPFTREKNSTVSKIQGTGLGMSIVKELVDLMGGKIDVRSELGKGTRFDIIIDFKINAEEEVLHNKEETDSIASLEGHRVLLVEDNEMNREIAQDILGDEGIIVEEAEDGTVAVELLREKGPDYYDYILMDIQMPVMNGYEATKAIRNMYPDAGLPIIALSANAFAEDKTASIAAGMNDHVAKPVNVEELKTVLAKYLK